MTVIKQINADVDLIHTKWEADYVSQEINRMFSTLPRGIYRGFRVTEMATPGSGVTINTQAGGYDSILVHRDNVNGYGTVLRYDADFDLEFTFTPGTTYYIYVDVVYVTSSATIGYIRVGESGDLGADSVRLAKFTVSSGTVISNSDITQDSSDSTSMTVPFPDDAEDNFWGLIDQAHFLTFPTQDQKDAMDNASSPSASNPFATENQVSARTFAKKTLVKFTGLSTPVASIQLSGWFYVGTGAAGTARRYFELYRLLAGEETAQGYLNSVDASKINITIYDNTNTAQLDPSTDPGVDADGFYQNPYIRFSPSLDRTEVGVWCGEKSTYGSIDLTDFLRLPGGFTDVIGPEARYWLSQIEADQNKTYTVDPSTTSAADYSGPTALQDALDAFEAAGSGGTLFVKKGDYTLSGSKTYTVPIRILCEGMSDGSGDRSRLTVSGAGSAVIFEGKTEIKGLDMVFADNAANVTFRNGCDVDDMIVEVGRLRVGAQLPISGEYMPQRYRGVKVEGDSANGVALQFAGGGGGAQNGLVSFTDCFFGVSSGSNNVTAILGGGTTANVVEFFGCQIRANLAGNLIDASSVLPGSYALAFRDCMFVASMDDPTPNTDALIQLVGPTNVVFDGNKVQVIPGGGTEFHRPILEGVSPGDGKVSITNCQFDLAGSPEVADRSALVVLRATGAGSLTAMSNCVVRGPSMGTSALRCSVIAARPEHAQSMVVIDGLNMAGLYSYGTGTRFIGILGADATTPLDGLLIISNSHISGVGLGSDIATDTTYGLQVAQYGGEMRVKILNSQIEGFTANDVYVSADSCCMEGVTGYGYPDQSAALPRWDLTNVVRPVVKGCMFDNVANTGPATSILEVEDNAVIMGNSLLQYDSRDAIVCDTYCTIIGNVGSSNTSYNGNVTFTNGQQNIGVADSSVVDTFMNAGLVRNPV